MITRRRFIAIAASALAAGPGQASGVPARWQGRALGAEASVELHGLDPQLLDDLPGLLDSLEDQFSLYRLGSQLSHLNRTGRLSDPAEPFAALLERCAEVHRATEGRFDPTVQTVWEALARGEDAGAAWARVGWDRVALGPGEIRLAPGQLLTLNGIAQGAASDIVADALRRAGARKVLVNIGEFAGVGGPWRIGLSDPGIGLYGWRSLTDGALATSSPSAMALPLGQSHILDPSGPAQPRWSSVTVEADTATLADAASTAMCLADREAVARMCRRIEGIRGVTLVDVAGDVVRL